MEWSLFSRRQLDLIANSTAFINIADGPVRSGKTLSFLVAWCYFVASAPPGDLMMVGKTERTLKRNVISPLIDVIGSKHVRYIAGAGELYLFGRPIYLVGANDEKAESKIRGSTLVGVYDNEVTLNPESVFKQLLARLSKPGARFFGDTNPDSPFHWLYTDYLTNDELIKAGDLKRWQFTIDDNPALTEEYKGRLKRLYTGLWYKRMILGLWVMADGTVYDFDVDVHVTDQLPERFDQVRVAVDYGTSNPTVFLLFGRFNGRWYVVREYYYDSKEGGRQKTDSEYADDFAAFLEGLHPQSIEIDPSAASFIAELRKRGHPVHRAQNEVLDGIRVVSRVLGHELLIHSSCRHTIAEMAVYSWDPKAQKKGEDKPLKERDHGPDALRYGAMRIFGRRGLPPVPKSRAA
jgi:PBSX family phage terminase large subunit